MKLYYFGLVYRSGYKGWEVGTALLTSRKDILDCIKIQNEKTFGERWILGSCQTKDVDAWQETLRKGWNV